ncbi:MAG: pgsA, partial [Rhodospirillales bacterium]|nr:pgsA [Rhodospirillales bacterium]
LGFLLVGTAGPQFGPLSTTEVGVWGLWIAAILTLVTGYDYLRVGLHHVDRMDTESAAQRNQERAGAPRAPAATDVR